MISSLAELVAPLTEEEFLALLRNRRPAFQEGDNERKYDGLLSWSTLRTLIDDRAIRPEDVRMTSKRTAVPAPFYVAHDKLKPAAINALLSHGASLIVTALQSYVPALGVLCRHIAERTSDAVTIVAIASAGEDGALRSHYDREDVFVVQLAGRKRWRIFGESIANPVSSEGDFADPQSEPIFDRTLRPGDALFLPSGYLHQCINGDDLSLHAVFGFTPVSGYRAVKSLLSLLADEPIFRTPLTRLPDADARQRLEGAIKSRVIEALKESAWTGKPAGKTEP